MNIRRLRILAWFKSGYHLIVIPACFWRESSHTESAGLDSRQKHAGMTVVSVTRNKMFLNHARILFFAALLLPTLVLPTRAESASKAPPDFAALLTAQEKDFLSQTEVIRVHNEMDWAPFNFNLEGAPKGFSIDYMKLLAQKIGLEIKFINGPTWDKFLEMTKTGELDVMLNIARSAERQEYLEYTPAYVTMIQMLYTRNDFPPVDSIKDLYGKRFAIPKGFFLHQILKEHPQIEIVELGDTTQTIMAVSTGKADALFDLMPVVDYITKQVQITNLKVGGTIGLEEGKPIPLHIAVRKDLKILAAIFEKGMKRISEDELEKLHSKWMTGSSQKEQTAAAAFIELTAEERDFLSGKKLRMGVDSARPPFEFINEKGDYSGISAEFMAILSRRLGIVITPTKDMKWTEAMEKVKVGEIDIIPKVTPTPEREKFMLFTRPYITFPSVIITRKDRFIGGMDDLVGLKVGVVKGLVVEANLKRDRPDLALVGCPDIESALRDLSTGKFDAFIDNLGTVTYSIDKIGLTNLKIAASTPYNHDLAIGVRKDWPLVVSALDKALAAMTDKEKTEIKSHWLAIHYQAGIDWKIVGPIGGALLAIIVFVLIWNRRLGRAVRERERAERELQLQAEELKAQQERLQETEAWFRGIVESAPDGILVADDRGVIILTNTMVDKMFGYESGELLGKNVDTLIPIAFRSGHELPSNGPMQTGTASDMGQEGLDLMGVRKDGSEYSVEIGLSKLPALGSRGPCVCASIRDIAERKAAELALAKSRERLQALLDTSPIAVAISTEGMVRFANPHFTKLLGPRVGDPSPQLYVNPADREQLVELLKQQEKVSDFDLQMYGTDNKIHDLMVTYLRTEYEGKTGILGWLVDITRIKSIEKALAEAEERSRLLLESAGEGIFGVDISGVMTFANPATLRLLGYEEKELLGQRIHPIIHHSRADGSPYPVDECPMMASYGHGIAHNVSDEVLWRKDGTSFYVNYSSTPMQKDGRVVGAVVTFRDVTEQKRVEEEISKRVKELERFNQLVTGREIKMIQLKNEINALRGELGKSAKFMAAVQACEDREFKIFSEDREESVFEWSLIGNIGEGRPNLGSTIDLGVYRLMHFSIRDVLLRKFNPETAAGIFFEAGELMGRELYKTMITKREDFDGLMEEVQELLGNLKICILEIEKANMESMSFTITLSENLDCSGMPASNETICAYDEGFLSGLLSEHTGVRFNVKEVNCWCSGDRLCRFEAKPAA